ncbi:NFYB/HAP3 family transcription factor subunit [Halobacteria archaeon AArc-curdl1]|uniref:NFYB/HAP3 family transcription factor subunit n=1 Tax=Natronosalvus hydrolyticus TaxID=2979988 RepID=A0AAP2Z553_9EURY|nr:NFYB/HAP3 family transcription factor subunit [Halobacteria archaeon AArc-curdl1]
MTEDDGEGETPSPVKPHSLKNFVKTQSDMRAGGDAVDELHHHLEFVAEKIWLEAAKQAEEDDRKTVKRRDVKEAIDAVTEPHDLIKETSRHLSYMQNMIDGQVEKSPLYAENRYDD